MKKLKLLLPFALFGLMLSSCDAAELRKNYTKDDMNIDTPWSDFYLPATEVEFADGEDYLELNKGETHTYDYSLSPKGATTNSLVWSSDEVSVASVENGVVTAVGAGEATITASSPENTFDPVSLEVKVNVPLTDFSVAVPDKIDWEVNQELEVTYTPEDTTYRDLVFTIENPSAEDVVIVDEDGTLHTSRTNGTATLRVHSDYLGAEKDKTYPLVIQNVPIESLAIDYDEGQEHTDYLEVDGTMKFRYVIYPDNASDYVRYGVRFVSDNEEVLTIDPVTGVATGIDAGTANVSVVCKDTVSMAKEITVYKSTVTSLSEVALDNTVLSNDGSEENPLSTRLHFKANYTNVAGSGSLTDKVPNRWTVTYSSLDEDIVTIDNTGLVEAKNPGNTSVRVSVSDGTDTLTEDVELSVYMVSKSIDINASSSVLYTDSPLELTASITPANISDDTIAWSASPVGVVDLVPNGKSVTVTSVEDELDSPVSVTITASNESAAHGGVAGTFELTVREREVNFEAGTMYLVGNRAFNTGTSVSGHTSWYIADGSNPRAARYAYKFVTECYDPEVTNQYKGTLHLSEGDEFRYFVGADYYVPVYEEGQDEEGNAWKGYHIQVTEGAFISGGLSLASDGPDANIVVEETGYYDFYAKRYAKQGSSDWYGLYICETPAIDVEIATAAMGINDEFTIKPVNVIGSVNYQVLSNTAEAEFDPATGKVSGTGHDGVVTVKVTDSRGGDGVTVTINVLDGASGVSKIIYLNANGHADQDNAKLYAHTWANGSTTVLAKDSKFNLVSGQDIVYSILVPVEHDRIVIVRDAPSVEHITWEGEDFWGQSEDLVIPTDGKNMWTSTGYHTVGEGEEEKSYLNGAWYSYDPSVHYEVEESFDGSTPFIVGDHTYATGTSAPGASWGDATKGYKSLVHNDGKDEDVIVQYLATITFSGGEKWKACLSGDYYVENYQSEIGAFSTENHKQMEMSGTDVLVNQAGTYEIYIKCLNENRGWQVYVAPTEVVKDEVTLYFANTKGWADGANMSAYAWKDGTPDSENAAWPGETMTYVGKDVDDVKVYSYTLDKNYYDRIIFVSVNNKTVTIDISSASNYDGWKATGSGTPVDDQKEYTVDEYTYEPKGPSVDNRDYYFTDPWGTGGEDMLYHAWGIGGDTGEWGTCLMEFVELNEFEQGIFKATLDVEKYQNAIFANKNNDEEYRVQIDDIDNYPTNTQFYLDNEGHIQHTTYTPPAPTSPELASISLSGTYKTTFDLNDTFDHEGLVVTAHYTQGKADADVTEFAEVSSPDMTTSGIKTVTVSYSDSFGEAETTYTINVGGAEPGENEVTIYFTNNWAWGSVYAYAFKGTTPKTAWPGDAMTKVGRNEDLQDVYSFTVDLNSFDTLVFNNGEGGNYNQTVDIDISDCHTNDAFYCSSRVESGTDQDKIIVGTWTFTSSSIVDEADVMKIYVTNNHGWSNFKVYIYNSSTEVGKTAWPGDDLKWEYTNEQSQDVYSFEILTTKYDAFVVNGSGGQTVDVLLSGFTDGNNAIWIKGTQVGGKYEVGYWKKA